MYREHNFELIIALIVVDVEAEIEVVEQWLPSNGLPITRAALIDRDPFLADSNAQNRHDLVDA